MCSWLAGLEFSCGAELPHGLCASFACLLCSFCSVCASTLDSRLAVTSARSGEPLLCCSKFLCSRFVREFRHFSLIFTLWTASLCCLKVFVFSSISSCAMLRELLSFPMFDVADIEHCLYFVVPPSVLCSMGTWTHLCFFSVVAFCTAEVTGRERLIHRLFSCFFVAFSLLRSQNGCLTVFCSCLLPQQLPVARIFDSAVSAGEFCCQFAQRLVSSHLLGDVYALARFRRVPLLCGSAETWFSNNGSSSPACILRRGRLSCWQLLPPFSSSFSVLCPHWFSSARDTIGHCFHLLLFPNLSAHRMTLLQ